MMFKNLLSSQKKQLVIRIPSTILSNKELTLNQKLVLGLDYTLSKKRGYNSLSNKYIAELLNLHINIVSKCRILLVKRRYVTKSGRVYSLTDKHRGFKVDYNREIIIPYEVYSDKDLCTGAKLLWGEYNSISKGYKEYFAKRLYTAQRLNVSEESITNWTKQLDKYEFLKLYEHNRGFCSNQKVVITCSFKDGVKDLMITHIKNDSGEWVEKGSYLLGFGY